MVKMEKRVDSENGYTMVELMVVVVVISILAASAGSYFGGTGVIAERSYRQEIMTAAKYAQQQAMFDTAIDGSGNRLRCYRLAIVSGAFGPQKNSGAGYNYFGDDYPITLTDGITTSPETLYIYFDGLGNSVADCNSSTVVQESIAVQGDTTVNITIETTGYVHDS